MDTNVISETMKPRPDPVVLRWLGDIDEDRVYISVITIAEISYGARRLPENRRRRALEKWVRNEVLLRFDRRVLPVDQRVALHWGDIMSSREASGRPVTAMDGLIAATAVVHGLALVTRNVADFEGSVPKLIDPWIEAAG